MQPKELPYKGSCHCGLFKYIAFISMPSETTKSALLSPSQPRFYKCNCSLCHKTGFFHLRLPNAANQFFILSPLDTDVLVKYQCNERLVNWLFCPRCGVRCMGAAARWKKDHIDLRALGSVSSSSFGMGTAAAGQTMGNGLPVWRIEPDGYKENETGYLTVNALTIDQDQPHGLNLDLRKLVDLKGLEYLDCKNRQSDLRYDYPQDGGTW